MGEQAEVFEPSGFFVLRTPLLPVDELDAWWTAADPRTALDELAARPAVRVQHRCTRAPHSARARRRR